METIDLKWQRPGSLGFPRVWHTFQAKDIGSDELVEYRIKDLPEDRFDEALEFIVPLFSKDEPLCEAYGLYSDPDAIDDFKMLWRSTMKQKVTLVCFKTGSDDIVGLNMNFITTRGEDLMEAQRRRNKSAANNKLFDIMALLYENYDTFENYGVDAYLSSVGLIVDAKYRGRGIGEQFLRTRRPLCEAFGIKLTSTVFTSNFSNKIADRTGFKLDKVISYDDIRKNHPQFELPAIRSDELTLKSLKF